VNAGPRLDFHPRGVPAPGPKRVARRGSRIFARQSV